MKRIILIISSFSLIFLYGCEQSSESSSSKPSDISTSHASSSFLSSTASSTAITSAMPSTSKSTSTSSSKTTIAVKKPRTNWVKVDKKRNYPRLEGDFIQPSMSKNFTYNQWCQHFDMLLDAGINMLIVDSSETKIDGKDDALLNTYYPAKLTYMPRHSEYKSYDMLDKCLHAAQVKGIKIFVCLNNTSDWWYKYITDKTWYVNQSKLSNNIAKEVYDLYKKKYPDAFYGWYWVPEVGNGLGGAEFRIAEMININLDYLTNLDPSMPLLLSPYIVKKDSTPETAQSSWTKFFSYAHFRKGDIFCCQDSVGAGGIDINELDAYYKALKNAVDTKPGLKMWANNESFKYINEAKTSFITAPLKRFVEQMKITDKYVEKHISFSYSHYYNPKVAMNAYNDLYIEYASTGIIPKAAI